MDLIAQLIDGSIGQVAVAEKVARKVYKDLSEKNLLKLDQDLSVKNIIDKIQNL